MAAVHSKHVPSASARLVVRDAMAVNSFRLLPPVGRPAWRPDDGGSGGWTLRGRTPIRPGSLTVLDRVEPHAAPESTTDADPQKG